MDHHHLVAPAAAGKSAQQVQALGLGLRVRQRLGIWNFQIGKKPHPSAPRRKLGSEFLLTLHIAADDPHSPFHFSNQQCRHERLRRFGDFRNERSRLGLQKFGHRGIRFRLI